MRGGPPRSLSQPRSLSRRRRRLLCDRRAEPGPAPRAVSGADGAEAPFCAAAGDGLGGCGGREVVAIPVAVVLTGTITAVAVAGTVAARD